MRPFTNGTKIPLLWHDFIFITTRKSVVNHAFLPSQYFLGRTRDQSKFLLRFPLAPFRNWDFYPDGALAPGEGSYFSLPGVMAGKMVVPPNVIEVLCADLLWRSFFWNACLRARLWRREATHCHQLVEEPPKNKWQNLWPGSPPESCFCQHDVSRNRTTSPCIQICLQGK